MGGGAQNPVAELLRWVSKQACCPAFYAMHPQDMPFVPTLAASFLRWRVAGRPRRAVGQSARIRRTASARECTPSLRKTASV
jgi:hypothetical protein